MVAEGQDPVEPQPGGLLLACQPLAYGCPLPLFALENLCERLGRYFLQSLGQHLDDARLAEGLGLPRRTRAAVEAAAVEARRRGGPGG